jgi:hypothetical protein
VGLSLSRELAACKTLALVRDAVDVPHIERGSYYIENITPARLRRLPPPLGVEERRYQFADDDTWDESLRVEGLGRQVPSSALLSLRSEG